MSELARFDPLRARLAIADSIQDVMEIKGIADGAAEFYEAQGDWLTAQLAKELSIRSCWKAGKILLPPEHGGSTPRKAGKRTDLSNPVTEVTEYQEALEQAGITHPTAVAWQKLARIPVDRVDEYFEEHAPEDDEYTIAGVMGKWYQRSDLIEWGTPQWLFNKLNQEFHFVLDVCASEANHKCKRYYTIEGDGLSQDWTGACWMNPPYGREIGKWMTKARHSAEAGATVVCLVPARPDTEWWWENCIRYEMRFIRGRLHFEPESTTAPFPSVVVVMRPEAESKVAWWDVRPFRET